MENRFFRQLESASFGHSVPLTDALAHLAFNDQGLIPVIAQDKNSKEVLMMAWMNKDAILKTLESGYMTYWSRSRNQFWKKGETSGHRQKLIEMRIDCDGDTLLCLVDQTGAACHTNRPNCFYLKVKDTDTIVMDG